MENNLDCLVRQAKNNINIIGVVPICADAAAISFEFQYRPKAGAQPHWVKSCEIVPINAIMGEGALHNLVTALVKIARAGLEE